MSEKKIFTRYHDSKFIIKSIALPIHPGISKTVKTISDLLSLFQKVDEKICIIRLSIVH